ncbi:hypothetical protein NMG60_11012823 [Bertholletia excelsa]
MLGSASHAGDSSSKVYISNLPSFEHLHQCFRGTKINRNGQMVVLAVLCLGLIHAGDVPTSSSPTITQESESNCVLQCNA